MWRYAPLTIILLAGMAVSIAVFFIVLRLEQAEVGQRFELEAEAHASILSNALVNAEEELASIDGLFSASNEVTRTEFESFTSAILKRHPELRALSWFPRVLDADRAAFVQSVRQRLHSNFRIRDVTEAGDLVPAAQSDEYFPGLYSVPSDRPGIERAWGFNPISNPTRRSALVAARDSGRRAATARIKLVSMAGNNFAVAIVQPIYRNGVALDTVEERRSALAGYVTGAFQVAGLVETRLQGVPLTGLDFYIFDMSNNGGPEFLYFHSSRTRDQSVEPSPFATLRSGMFAVRTLEAVGRPWQVVFKPAPGYFAAQTWHAWMLLFGGLLLTATLTLYQRSILIRNERVTGLVIKRTRELESSEKRLGGILENANDAIISIDGNRRIILFNQGAQRAFGYSADEVFGQPLDMLLPSRFRHAHKAQITGFAGGTALSRPMTMRTEIFGLHKNGKEFPAIGSISKINLEGTTIFTVMLRDITERKAMEDQFRQAQKMEAVGQLTGGVAHDFNNLLAIIEGNLSLLGDLVEEGREFGPEEVRKFIAPALRAGRRGAELTHRLLAFSRIQALQPVALDINTVLKGMADLLARTLGETIDINWHLKDGDWLAEADASELENVLLNLALNARDAMPEGGRLTIETGEVTLDDEYAKSRLEVDAGDYVLLLVSDSGDGMDADTLAKVFEPFFTTKGVGKGTGLGLSMVYGFAKQSGGHVAIYSEPGHGTTVKLFLPRTQSTSSVVARETAQSGSAGGGERILVVEDNEEVRDITMLMLRNKGYTVFVAEDGKTALEILENEETFDLLLADVVLPGGMSGPELANAVQETMTGLKVLFMSGYSEKALLHRGGLREGVNLIGKPFSPAALGAKVRRILDTSE